MVMEIGNLMSVLSSSKLDGEELSADTEVSPGLFWGELLGQLKQYDDELDLETLDPAEIAQQLSGFLEQTRLPAGDITGQAEWLSSGERFLQQLKGFTGTATASQDSGQVSLADILAEESTDQADAGFGVAEPVTGDNILDQDALKSMQSLIVDEETVFEREGLVPDPRIPGLNRASPASAGSFSLPPLDKQIGQPEWQQGLGDRIQWMTSAQISSAELKLNPVNLGPLEIRVQMENDQASITFSSQHASVREAVEAALPRLKEMLSAQQLDLGSIEVNQQQSQSNGGRGDMPSGPDSGRYADSNNEQPVADSDRHDSTVSTILPDDGIVSYYV